MKLACASGAFDRTIHRGDLTQLEFIERCARELACDGIVLDVRHFPRTDDDYLAQLKKFATDLGLCIAAVDDDGFFAGDAPAISATLALATRLGAPLVTGRLLAETARSWSEQAEILGIATGQAKAANVTLALRNAPGTFAAAARDCKRAMKEADSAWLRVGLDVSAISPEDGPALAGKAVLLWRSIDDPARFDASAFDEFRGTLVLDDASGNATAAGMQNALRDIRNALATRELNRT
ncbi:MAG TPA: hypothetical protein VMW12_03775 [Candidatus Dormibacteraeota bacterium]|nr:hypothetical protein [Candidatus Dormibacteraeota bacterium]